MDRNRNGPAALDRIRQSSRFTVDDIDVIAKAYGEVAIAIPGTGWDWFYSACLVLPPWFRSDLDPLSPDYMSQQRRLWRVVSGTDRDYSPELDESEIPLRDVDPVRSPGYYISRDDTAVQRVGDHLIATGMIMKHCGLKAGCWALEYGPGFGQIALALARMGVNVDTVDISSTFCGFVKEQAEFFKVRLTPFCGQFGYVPRREHKYDLILFYESLHHCLEFREVVPVLRRCLAPAGRIMFAGEPIRRALHPAVPYPWGVRLSADAVAVIRDRHWFELGFNEEFIVNYFINQGFTAIRHNCDVSIFGETYSFTFRENGIDLGTHWMPDADATTWHHPDSGGRWTRQSSTMGLDSTNSFGSLEIVAVNHFPFEQEVSISYGGKTLRVVFNPGERKRITVNASIKSRKIVFSGPTHVPADHLEGSGDTRSLGIFVEEIAYI